MLLGEDATLAISPSDEHHQIKKALSTLNV